jgi:hypothetical protein
MRTPEEQRLTSAKVPFAPLLLVAAPISEPRSGQGEPSLTPRLFPAASASLVRFAIMSRSCSAKFARRPRWYFLAAGPSGFVQYGLQQTSDIAYTQCMYAKGMSGYLYRPLPRAMAVPPSPLPYRG